MISSMAGGTGSGVGSYVMELIKQEHPKCNLINYMVAPKSGGEVIL